MLVQSIAVANCNTDNALDRSMPVLLKLLLVAAVTVVQQPATDHNTASNVQHALL
jgi:hypothetical protein